MHIEGTINYNNIFVPNFLSIENQHGEKIKFQPPKDSDTIRSFDHQLQDLPDISNIETFKFTSEDGNESSDTRIAFHYIVHPGMRAIIIPPNSVEMTHIQRKKGYSNGIQRFFEALAFKYRYKLIVGITPETMQNNNQRVQKILRSSGYYLGPSSQISKIHYGVHQSTYDGNGIPEIGMGGEYFIPPTSTNQI